MARHITSLVVSSGQSLTRSDKFADDLNIAIADLLHENQFIVSDLTLETYDISVRKEEQRIVFDVTGADYELALYMKPLRGLMRDYLMMVESYQQAIRDHDSRKIEAVDMGRRGMHNEGAQMLLDMWEHKVKMDFSTARRLFTIVAIMHMR